MPERRPDTGIKIRIIIIMAVFGFCTFFALGLQIYSISVTQHVDYQQRAISQQTRDSIISPERGTIFDRNMKPLAMSATVETVYISPADFKDDAQRELTALGLSRILGVDYGDLLEKAKKNNYYQTVKKRIESDSADAVREFIGNNNLENIVHLVEDTKRFYPYGNFASHIIGFCDGDNIGIYGIELQYEEYLKGSPGRMISAKNAKGTDMNFEYEAYYDAQDGANVVLTIDETVQHYLEKHLETAWIENNVGNKAVGIVYKVKTGEVLGMSTKPDFDLNNPRIISDETLSAGLGTLEGDQKAEATLNALYDLWRNKAIQDPYEPGSVFKIITAAMGLEEAVVRPSDGFFCSGVLKVGGHDFHCWRRQGHGSETFVQGLENSCNPVFIEVGRRVGSTRFMDYMSAFNLKKKTGIDLPGEANSITHASNFNEVELSTYAFGQTFKITPIQMIAAASAAVNNGYYMQPHVVKALVDDEGNVIKNFEPTVVSQVVSAESSATLREMLETVVSVGTGKNSYVPGYRIGGKTGTSEKIDKKDANGEANLRIASFIGFAPANDPEIAVLIILDEPDVPNKNGGVIAAPVVRRILSDVLPYLGIEQEYTLEEVSALEVETPNLRNMTLEQAKAAAQAKGIDVKIIGDGAKVTDQVPAPGAKVPKSAGLIIYMGAEKPAEMVEVPDISGMSYTKALKELEKVGLYMQPQGAISVSNNKNVLSVSRQEPSAGTPVSFGSLIIAEFNDAATGD